MGGCESKEGAHDTHKKISKFKTADELEKFETFFPAGTNSALSRALTKEIWEEYKG
jgi:hypothetical protein